MTDVIRVALSKWRWVRAAGVALALLLLIGWLSWSAVAQKDADWLTQLPNFIRSLGSHWFVLLSGGAGVVALGFWERQHRQIGFPQYVTLTIAAIIPAAYLSWLDEHQLRVQAEAQLVNYNNGVAQRQRFIHENLTGLYVEAQSLLHERITAADFPDWAARENAFGHGAESWIKENMGIAAMMKFQDMNSPSFDFAGFAVSPDHRDALNWLEKVSTNLQAMMNNPTWDARAPKPPELPRGS